MIIRESVIIVKTPPTATATNTSSWRFSRNIDDEDRILSSAMAYRGLKAQENESLIHEHSPHEPGKI